MRHFFTYKPIYNSIVCFLIMLGVNDPLSIKAQTTISVPVKIKTEQARLIKNAATSVFMDDTTQIANGITNAEGVVTLNLSAGQDYRVRVEKSDEPFVGVTSYDCATIARHIMDIELIPSPYGIIAADVDENGLVDAADIVHIRNFILKRKPSLPNRQWRFVDKNYVFKNPKSPLNEDFPEYIDFSKVNKETKGEFVAIKIGDATSGFPSTRANFDEEDEDILASRSLKELTLLTEDIAIEAGKEYKIALKALDFKAIAYQFALAIDNNKAQMLALEAADVADMTEDNYAFVDNAVRVSWNGMPTNNTSKLFYLTILAKDNARLSDILTFDSQQLRSIAFDADGNPMKLQLNFVKNKVEEAQAFTLFQNYPNPVATTTTIGFNMPTESEARLTVFDLQGKVIKAINRTFGAGYNEVTLHKEDFSSNGIFYYSLNTLSKGTPSEQYSAIKKMFVVAR